MPRSIDRHADFRVVKLAKMSLFHEPASGDHKRSEAELEVVPREKALAPAAGENALGHGESIVYGLLHEYGRARGKQI